ncbi:MAG: MBL fold metallo-hydrolase [Verrucomicrobia bacterium]|nr:MBL fold metallo-hydrolase [Verrucomicrobiota bacterium]
MQAERQGERRRVFRRRWLAHLWREWIVESRRPLQPAYAKPQPRQWPDDRLTAAWLGHSTVLINFFGLRLITDPVLFPRIGIRLPFITVGPKRLTMTALNFAELPPIDLVLISHAHFDHLDRRTLMMFDSKSRVITAQHTRDLFRGMRFAEVIELSWGESTHLRPCGLEVEVRAFRGQHWGARVQRDEHRRFNGYVISRGDRRIIYSGDTAMTNAFAQLRDGKRYDLAIMSIGAYDPWIRSHATPEQAVAMADAAAARFIMPVHHQTFRLSAEPFREPIERFTRALAHEPERIALREIGETFVLPE